MITPKKRGLFISIFMLIVLSLALKTGAFFRETERVLDFPSNKKIFINDNGFSLEIETQAKTIEEFLREKKINLKENDQIFPEKSSSILPGMNIKIRRSVEIKIKVDGKNLAITTLEKSIREALEENQISLGRLDKVSPSLSVRPENKMMVEITRINVEEKIVSEEIAFKTIEKQDNKLSWREKKTEQEGEKGIREVKYKITYKNGGEISRIVLEKKITKEPKSEIITKGTYVKLGKSHSGAGTWYSFKGGLFAANPWLPMGSYVKVTNLENGKSVIVQINDRGPFGPGRIIDLDKIAFQKIASLGAGVINVKMEEILN